VNEFLATRYLECVHRLVVGIDPIDASTRHRVSWPIRIARDRALALEALERLRPRRLPVDDVLPRLEPHATRVHVVLWERDQPWIPKPRERPLMLKVRLSDARRRFVPRCLEIPVAGFPAADPKAALDALTLEARTRTPWLYPGAAYPVNGLTALRGRVLRRATATDPQRPARWARIEARVGGLPVGVAHGDDRGEFLLLISSLAAPSVQLPARLNVEVQAFVPPETSPFPTWRPEVDPLWDLPPERLADPGTTPDPVAEGATRSGYTHLASRSIALAYGQTTSVVGQPFLTP
jgi:hypothetical protein